MPSWALNTANNCCTSETCRIACVTHARAVHAAQIILLPRIFSAVVQQVRQTGVNLGVLEQVKHKENVDLLGALQNSKYRVAFISSSCDTDLISVCSRLVQRHGNNLEIMFHAPLHVIVARLLIRS